MRGCGLCGCCEFMVVPRGIVVRAGHRAAFCWLFYGHLWTGVQLQMLPSLRSPTWSQCRTYGQIRFSVYSGLRLVSASIQLCCRLLNLPMVAHRLCGAPYIDESISIPICLAKVANVCIVNATPLLRACSNAFSTTESSRMLSRKSWPARVIPIGKAAN